MPRRRRTHGQRLREKSRVYSPAAQAGMAGAGALGAAALLFGAKTSLEAQYQQTETAPDGTTVAKAAAIEAVEYEGQELNVGIDEQRLEPGAPLDIELLAELRPYQRNWVDQFSAQNRGLFVGPSGSGKTISAMGVMDDVSEETLIVVPERDLARQWNSELVEKTTLQPHQVGQYHGATKEIRPVTVATYDTASMPRYQDIFNRREWGLIIADEAHHALADEWSKFGDIEHKRRLGMTATPVRGDADPADLFGLFGQPVGSEWDPLFEEEWVARPDVELVSLPWGSEDARRAYQEAEGARKLVTAAKNPAKTRAIKQLVDEHADQQTVVFADWIEQGQNLSSELDAPFIHGETPHDDREAAYNAFRAGDVSPLIVSRVGDEGIDLPDAEVAILASTLGSSQAQTGQRAGRTMRPGGASRVYLLTTRGTGEEEWGAESTEYLRRKGATVSESRW